VGQRNHPLDGVQIAACEGTIFRGKDMPEHARRHCRNFRKLCKNGQADRDRLWTLVGLTKHVLGGVYTGTSWRIPLNRLCAAAMRPFIQITLTTCYYY